MMWSNSERRVSQPEIQSFSDRTPRRCYAHRVQDQLKSRHPFLYLFSRRRQSRSQLHQLTVFIDIEHVFDPHTQVLFRNVDRSEEHTSELQSPIDISYAVFCL